MNGSDLNKESGFQERSPESIGAEVFLHREHGLNILCPSEDTRKVAEEKDDQGRVIKEKTISESGVVLLSEEHQYDERGNRRTVLKDYKDQVIGTIDSSKKSTKDGGQEVAHVYFDAQGRKLCSIEYVYDQNDRVKSITHRDPEGKISGAGRDEYEYDEQGRISKRVERDKNGNVLISTEYERDESGHIYHTIVRDGEGNIIEELGQAKGAPKQEYGDISGPSKKDDTETKKAGERISVEQKYDKNGKVIARIFKDEEGNVKMSIEYERDEVGKIFHTIIKDDIGGIIGESWRAGYQQAA